MTDLRTIERDSIRAFVQRAAKEGYLSGQVLDYGCGKQPYRDIVEAAGGEYFGFDNTDLPANVSDEHIGGDEIHEDFDACLCTQVVQYVPDIVDFIFLLSSIVAQKHGHLVLTYPTNWPEVEPEDLHRFTKAGMERLLTEAGFEIVLHEQRASVRVFVGEWHTDEMALGYGVVARA